MTVSKNPITGDLIQTKIITEQYRENYDLIFSKKLLPVEKINLDINKISLESKINDQ